MQAGAVWARVLHRYVNAAGRIDFYRLREDSSDLREYVDYLSRVSPEGRPDLFPTRNARLAYYINAYNALSMFNVIQLGIPKSLTWFTKVRFFGLTRFSIGGTRMSLYAFENDVIRPLGDERVHFALNCMSVSCPKLPNVPFVAERLDEQLDQAARSFFSETRNLRVDRAGGAVYLSSILKFYREDFLKHTSDLIVYVNRYAPQTVPSGLNIAYIPYDWTVNAVSRDASSDSQK